MIAALLLAACLAQAEAAPVEPAAVPTPPPAGDPGPAEAAPTPPPREKAEVPANTTPAPPAAPTPSTPAPGSPSASAPSAPANTVSILGGLASRLGSDAAMLGPSVGFSFGGSFQRRYASLSPELELGWAAEFLFTRFATSVLAVAPTTQPGVQQVSIGTRTISETTFGLLQTLDTRRGATHVWLGVGGGLAVGFFSSPEADLHPGSVSARQPFARAAGGADVALNDQTSLGVRAGYTFMLTPGPLTTAGAYSVRPFGDLLDILVGLFYRFR